MYEQFRHAITSRLMEADIPAPILSRVLLELDVVSQDYKIERACTDLILPEEGVPRMVQMYIASLAVRNCAKGTLDDYTRGLCHFFDTVRKSFAQVTTNDIRLYLYTAGQQNKWSPETTDHKRTIINSFFGWCVDNEYIARNPARTIPVIKCPKKKLKPLKQIELEEMRNACETPRERALVDVLFATGARASEAAAIMLSDINWTEHSIIIRHGKGDKERIVFFNAEAEISMKNYISSRDGSSPWLFCKLRTPHTGVTRNVLEKEIRNIRERVPGLSVKATPHTFRRTTATVAADRGMPVQDIQFLLGHSSIETTMRYISMSDQRVGSDYSRYMAG